MAHRIHRIIFFFALLFGCARMSYVRAAVYSGTCGANATWSLNTQTAILVISGTGAIDDYTNTNQIPWYSYRSSIIGVSISNGITRIGQATCYNCFNLTSVSMGTGVTSIGTSAFYGCSKLPSITIGNQVHPLALVLSWAVGRWSRSISPIWRHGVTLILAQIPVLPSIEIPVLMLPMGAEICM